MLVNDSNLSPKCSCTPRFVKILDNHHLFRITQLILSFYLFLDVKVNINSFDGQSFMIELKKAPLVLGLMLDSFDTQSMRLDSPPVTEL